MALAARGTVEQLSAEIIEHLASDDSVAHLWARRWARPVGTVPRAGADEMVGEINWASPGDEVARWRELGRPEREEEPA
jgi:hypothetical protein